MDFGLAERGSIPGFRSGLLIGLGFLFTVIIGALDFFTGFEVSLSLFYLVPVMLVTWYTTTIAGACVSIAGALTWFIADLMSGRLYSHPLIGIWDALIQMGVLLTVSFLLAELRKALERERKSARIDALTGIPNSRAFHETAEAELHRAQRFHRPLSVAYLDFDNFKVVNDKEGHEAGDRLLRSAAEEMRSLVRAVDLVARIGGDEFALLFPETDPEQAKTVTAKIQKGIADLSARRAWPVTLSIGVVTYFTAPSGVDEMLKDADDLMYAAKTSGKADARYDVVN